MIFSFETLETLSGSNSESIYYVELQDNKNLIKIFTLNLRLALGAL